MTQFFFIRKNNIYKCKESGKKGNITRVWYRSKAAADGWAEVGKEAADQLEKDLREKRLTLIPDKLITSNREAWAKYNEDKPSNPFDDQIL